MPENVSTLDNETDHLYGVTQIGNTTTRTTVNDSDFFTVLPTRTSVRVTENVPLPNTEKHVLYPEKFTTVAPETTNVLVTPTTEGTISTTAPEVKEVAETTISSEVQSSITAAITDILHTTAVSNTVLFYPKDLEKTTMQNDIDDNSMMKPSEIDQTEESDDVETVLTKEYTPVPTESIENTLHTKDEATTMPQNFQIPPNGIFVVSDGLLSDRTDVEEGVGERKDAKDSFWDLVSSVSVAGGVALALIVMAAITVLVSQRRNRKKVSIAESKRSSQRRREADQLPPPPAPQMYNYTDDVTTLPPYLELQYDIPPSAMNSKTNSFQPVPENNTQLGSEPEHLYDEIPCWRSNRTTSTNTDTDTSRC
ncbi:hypothetical protein C0J52_20338 [Blattella germanica]|nr:hypothetical protein C0J52_20338 [Blattella germanica]